MPRSESWKKIKTIIHNKRSKKEIPDLLNAIGMEINDQDETGKSLLDYAVVANDTDLCITLVRTMIQNNLDREKIPALLEKIGPKISAHDNMGKSLLDYAAAVNDTALCITLAEWGTDLNWPQAKDQTPHNYRELKTRQEGQVIAHTPYATLKQRVPQDPALTTLKKFGAHILSYEELSGLFYPAYYDCFLKTASYNLHLYAPLFRKRLGITDIGCKYLTKPSPNLRLSPTEMMQNVNSQQLNAMDHLRLATIWDRLTDAYNTTRNAICRELMTVEQTEARMAETLKLPGCISSAQNHSTKLKKDVASYLQFSIEANRQAIEHLRAHEKVYDAHYYLGNTKLLDFRRKLFEESARLSYEQLQLLSRKSQRITQLREARVAYLALTELELLLLSSEEDGKDPTSRILQYSQLYLILAKLDEQDLAKQVTVILSIFDKMCATETTEIESASLTEVNKKALSRELYKNMSTLQNMASKSSSSSSPSASQDTGSSLSSSFVLMPPPHRTSASSSEAEAPFQGTCIDLPGSSRS